MDNENDLSAVNELEPAGSSFERFENWLTNTFWFHYKWYFIAAVFGVTLLILILIGLVADTSYDWTVIYSHSGGSDSARCDEIKSSLEALLPETGDNRRVDVRVVELSEGGEALSEYGEKRIYSYLNDPNCVLYILDGETLSEFNALGYFENATPLFAMPGLYGATNDSPVQPLSTADERYADYSQSFLDEVYLELVEEHEGFIAAAKEAISALSLQSGFDG